MGNGNNKGGRKPKAKKRGFIICVRMDDVEFAAFQNMMDKYAQNSISNFVRDCIFNHEIKVVTADKTLYKVVEWLTKIHSQYRAIGTNYNQAVKQINACFNANQAAHLIAKLENYTISLVKLSEQIAMVTNKLKEKYGGKS
jgi:hypothetical protein